MAQLVGKVQQVLPVCRGMSERGEWVRAGLVVSYGENVKRQAALTVFGEKRMQMLDGIKVGEAVIVEYYPESREFDGKWFTDLMTVRILVAREGGKNGTE